ncbi:MAG: hypothetical protein AAB209_12560 [Bacteroidota bacterium]
MSNLYVGYFENGRKRWKSTGATLKAVSNLEELFKDKKLLTQIYSHLLPEQLHGTVNRLEVSLN